MDPRLEKAYSLLEGHKIIVYETPSLGDRGLYLERREDMGNEFNNKVPNPGSDEALAIGCKCPVLDNCRGKGYLTPGSGTFCIAEHCPIHGKAAQDEEAKTEER
jgi:hypothetical protein